MQRALTLCCLCLLITACGFQLRGYQSDNAPPVQLHIESALPDKALPRALSRQWQLAVGQRQQGKVWRIRLLDEAISSRGVLRGVDGRANQYEVLLLLSYQWQTPVGEWMPVETMRLSKSYFQPSQDLIGQGRQRDEVVRDLREQAALRLIDQLMQLDRSRHGD